MNIKKLLRNTFGVMIILSGMLLFGCSNNEQENVKEDKPIIAVTIVPEQTFVEAVCGDLAEVVVLVPPGNSPENYEPTPMVIEKFSKASLYFSIGVSTEEANILPKATDIKTIALQDEVALIYDDRTFESNERDPHIWLSPKRVKVMIEVISREMGKLDVANKETYEKNAKAYIEQLDELDKEIKESLDGVQNKKIIVYHPAFGYLADDYSLEMYSLEEEGKESTVMHLQEMIDLAKKENIKAIFYQEEIDSSQSKAFAEEIGGKTVQLSPLAADYIDNLKKMAETISEVMQ
ncbi:zinc transport system substrate-binding protein [Sedimentibacter acidaminivorans]|uniref:Zinc transport system substrate-binding protein n=1 Tax=Sedimentibacter acidaminivorans TaxID=913099 RepID=A0ABS4GBP0_9FIRM|nr:zinc ABC transporter substrate-binding protein [Sedimentibacter acidaminivorans]MBP1925087.1 zinc transport system substrate-binding protein [Sedimentibacter acidaminivorans]